MREPVEKVYVDNGKEKKFSIRPMSAMKASRWAIKFGTAVGSFLGSTQIKDGVGSAVKVMLNMDEEVAAPLMEMLLSECRYVTPENKTIPLNKDNADSFIEDAGTLMTLYRDSYEASFSFYEGGAVGLVMKLIPELKRQIGVEGLL